MTDLDDLVAEWGLRPDGDPIHTVSATLLPVRSEGTPAVVRVGIEGDSAHLVLRRWNGDGAVLLERLHTDSLDTLDDVAACEVVAGLYRRLHIPAMPQLRSLSGVLSSWGDGLAALPRSAPIPHRLVEQAVALCRDLATEPADHVLHGNLHYGNVLAADRAPWLAISPSPLNGGPAFELAPMLWQRWNEIADHVRVGVQRRFYAVIDAAGFDEDRARSWVIVRVVRAAALALDGDHDPTTLTRYVTLAKAVQD